MDGPEIYVTMRRGCDGVVSTDLLLEKPSLQMLPEGKFDEGERHLAVDSGEVALKHCV